MLDFLALAGGLAIGCVGILLAVSAISIAARSFVSAFKRDINE